MKPMAWSLSLGIIAGILGGVVYGYFSFDSEPAPILGREWIMLIGAVLGALIGLVAGFIVGCLLSSSKSRSQSISPPN
jgi:hypothetical protein